MCRINLPVKIDKKIFEIIPKQNKSTKMTSLKIAETNWYPEKRLLVTHISGDLDKDDIEQWERSFKNTLGQIDDCSTFKIFVNMYGFKAVDIEAHKSFRGVVPLTL